MVASMGLKHSSLQSSNARKLRRGTYKSAVSFDRSCVHEPRRRHPSNIRTYAMLVVHLKWQAKRFRYACSSSRFWELLRSANAAYTVCVSFLLAVPAVIEM